MTLYERIYFNVVKFDGECCRQNWSRIRFNKPENCALFCWAHVFLHISRAFYFFFVISKVFICGNCNKNTSPLTFHRSSWSSLNIRLWFCVYFKISIETIDFPFFSDLTQPNRNVDWKSFCSITIHYAQCTHAHTQLAHRFAKIHTKIVTIINIARLSL